MDRSVLDHLVVTAPTLDAGVAYVEDALGATPQGGGRHERMGTHNRLLRLGEGTYLEVIAIDPDAPTPARPRWFALDALGRNFTPSLSAWVARTSGIHAVVAGAVEALGEVEPMSRGDLEWLITITRDGTVPLAGAGPALIEWRTGGHPASRLEDHGLALATFELSHPEPDRVSRLLASIGLQRGVSVASGEPGIAARIDTPLGAKRLASKRRESLALRAADLGDLAHLRRWDEEVEVFGSDPHDDWNWELELARSPPWREQLIAELDGRPIGFMQIIDPREEESRYWGDVPENLRALDIWIGAAADRGKGHGTRMMQLALARCFAAGAAAVLIDPLATNVRSHRFYERLGFVAIGPRRFGEDQCLVFRLERSRWMAILSARFAEGRP